jgi:hypothetical protein
LIASTKILSLCCTIYPGGLARPFTLTRHQFHKRRRARKPDSGQAKDKAASRRIPAKSSGRVKSTGLSSDGSDGNVILTTDYDLRFRGIGGTGRASR